MVGLAIVFIVAAVLYGLYWFFVARFSVGTDDAYVHGNQVAVMARVKGTVTTINADDTDRVQKGEVIVVLDRADARLTLDKAEAALARAVRHVRELQQNEKEQQAIIVQRRVALAQVHHDYQRGKRLVRTNVITQQAFQHRKTQWQSARAALKQARHHLNALKTQTAGADLRHQPDVRQAIAAVRSAWLDIKRTKILAPVSGYVARRHVQVGQAVGPDKPLMAIVPLKRLWVTANFKETSLDRMRIGQAVELTSDFYGSDVTYHGRVAGLSAGTGSAFELLPPQNATGNWIKVVRRVPVRIRLQSDELAKHPLRLGLSMHATVDVHDTSGKALARRPVKKPVYQTGVYARRVAGAKQLVSHIIKTNDTAAASQQSDGG
jgi:membrane fusion protein (multidrug efflux system)